MPVRVWQHGIYRPIDEDQPIKKKTLFNICMNLF